MRSRARTWSWRVLWKPSMRLPTGKREGGTAVAPKCSGEEVLDLPRFHGQLISVVDGV